MILPIIWVTCAVVIVAAAIRAPRGASALRTGRLGVGTLYLAAGAAVNAWFLIRGDNYAKFAANSYLGFVRHAWRDLVVPNHYIWISLLITFELAVGVLALLGGRRTQVAYGAGIAFHAALLSFGWGFYLWSVPMIAALVRLLHAERRAGRTAHNHETTMTAPLHAQATGWRISVLSRLGADRRGSPR